MAAKAELAAAVAALERAVERQRTAAPNDAGAYVLRGKELEPLASLLLDESAALEVTSMRFHKAYARQHQFRAACTLSVMLGVSNAEPVSETPARLAALFVLADLHRSEPLRFNPFLGVLLDVLDAANARAELHAQRAATGEEAGEELRRSIERAKCERTFCVHLLLHPKKVRELRSRPPAAFMASFDAAQAQPLQAYDLSQLRRYHSERHAAGLVGPRGVALYESFAWQEAARWPAVHGGVPGDERRRAAGGALYDAGEELGGARNVVRFVPEFVRPRPPVYAAGPRELRWAGWRRGARLEWDARMCAPEEAGGVARKMMRKATRQPLTDEEARQLLAEVGATAEEVRRAGLTPAKLPGLVEKNPAVAKACIKRIVGSPQAAEYLTVLVGMEMSLHSMEVVNYLTSSARLPVEFIILYVNNCIRSCQSIKDKYLQNRLVRLVCVFLQALIRNKIIDVRDVFIEVQAFCIEFSRIKEAAGLFRLLKTLENSG